MRKHVLVAVFATVVLGGTAIALASDSDRRVPSTSTAESKPIAKKLANIDRRLKAADRVSCQSFGCINRTLTRLTADVRALKRDVFRCEKYVDVTSYSGYVYTPDGGNTFFETTAIDYTAEGDRVSDHVVVYTC